MKIQTEYGEQDLQEVVRCYHLWKKYIESMGERRRAFIKTEKGKEVNRARSKAYYERNKDKILEKRRLERIAEKEQPQFID